MAAPKFNFGKKKNSLEETAKVLLFRDLINQQAERRKPTLPGALNESEANAVAGVRSLEPSLKGIEERINSGIFNQPPIVREFNQFRVDTGNPLLVGGEMEKLQSDLNSLKTQLPFSAGGKQLTRTEKELVFRKLNTLGKDNDTIVKDLNDAFQLLREKEKLAIQGTGGVNPQPTDTTSGSFRIRVRNRVTGQTGTIPDTSFDESKYERI